jgi:hypothetical protein
MTQQSNVLIDFVKWLMKWVAIVTGGLIGLGLVLVGGFWTWNWWTYERPKSQISVLAINSAAPAPERKGFANGEECVGTEYPIAVVFLNGSAKTIEYIELHVSARLPGRSTDILTYDARAKFDRIVEPKYGWGSCYRFPVSDEFKNDPEVGKAVYSAKISYVRFKDD